MRKQEHLRISASPAYIEQILQFIYSLEDRNEIDVKMLSAEDLFIEVRARIAQLREEQAVQQGGRHD